MPLPCRFIPRKRLGLVWTGAENLAPSGTRSPNRPFRSESLYRLSYPGPQTEGVRKLKMQNTETKTRYRGVIVQAIFTDKPPYINLG